MILSSRTEMANWNGPLVSIYEKVISLNNNHEHGC